MNVFERVWKAIRNQAQPEIMTLPELIDINGVLASSGQTVTAETSKNISTAYRCINIISDDFAKMPLQTFVNRVPGKIERLRPSNVTQNIAWLLEVSPNRWMTPFVMKKTLMQWLLCYGNAYAWMPPRSAGGRREIFVLNSSATYPLYDLRGNLWYQTIFANGETRYLPDVEVMHLLINSLDGINGRSIITYARESLGRQLGAYETQAKFYKQGLNPGGLLWMNGEVDKTARQKVRDAYEEAMTGSSNAYRLAVLDNKVAKFEQITMKPVDVQFLEGIAENDTEIANFFGMPLYKLNMGKQAYSSNEQQNLDYLSTTLDPYLVQTEQASALRWLTEDEQNYTYFRFNRDALLRTDAMTRAQIIEKRIQSGVLTPNEGRQIDDLSTFDGGDSYYIPANIAVIMPDGSPKTANTPAQNVKNTKKEVKYGETYSMF
jgi:HK97 family phage portal protein